jgi:predicted alpha-1,6-mannanase (GH76 family)
MDGIDTNRLWLDGTARQQRRVEGYRIEELFTQGVMTSVDVEESGEVKYSEWTRATSLVSTKKQLAAVRKCVERFGVARK